MLELDETPLRMTSQRKVIIDELRGLRTHPTADELFLRVRKKRPRISLSTVYRNLEQLAGCGLIQKLDLCGSQRRYDGDTAAHHHVRCLRCGRVDDIPSEAMGDLRKGVCKTCDYEIIGYRLEYLGFCPRCRKQVRRGKPVKPKPRKKG